MKLLMFGLLVLSSLFALIPASQAEILVVAAESSFVEEATVSQVQAAFLSQPAASGELQLLAVDREDGPLRLRDRFYERAVGRSITRMKAHWSQLIFTGRGNPPERARDLEDLKRILKAKPLAVGFIGASENTSGLKVLLRLNGE